MVRPERELEPSGTGLQRVAIPRATSDPRRYEQFLVAFTRCQSRLFRYVLVLVPNWNDAEEIFQEVSLVLWRSFDQFTPGTDFYRWAARVALNQVLSFRRRQKRFPYHCEREFLESVAEETLRQGELLEDRLEALSHCLGRLRQSDLELIRACYAQPTTVKAASDRLQRPADTVYKALRRIRRRLFECINRTVAAQARG